MRNQKPETRNQKPQTTNHKPLSPPIHIVHVGHNQPAPRGVLAQRKSELSRIRLPLLLGEASDDVTNFALSRKRNCPKRKRTALPGIVLLDCRASSHRWPAAW